MVVREEADEGGNETYVHSYICIYKYQHVCIGCSAGQQKAAVTQDICLYIYVYIKFHIFIQVVVREEGEECGNGTREADESSERGGCEEEANVSLEVMGGGQGGKERKGGEEGTGASVSVWTRELVVLVGIALLINFTSSVIYIYIHIHINVYTYVWIALINFSAQVIFIHIYISTCIYIYIYTCV